MSSVPPSERPKLALVIGDRSASATRGGRRASLSADEQVICYTCEGVHGVATSAVTQVVEAPRRNARGRLVGGRKIWACAHCLARGVITELLKV